MSYLIYDNDVSIGFNNEGNHFLLLKHAIKEISVIRNEIISISADNCSGGISFRYSDVVDPVTVDISDLVNTINTMIVGYVEPPPNR